MRPRVLFLDHAGVLSGAELCLFDVVSRYRDAATVLLFSDGPFRIRLESVGIDVRVFDAGAALLGVRKHHAAPSVGALAGLLQLARRVAPLARDFDLLYANSQKAFLVASAAGLLARRPVLWFLHDMLSRDQFSQGNIRVAVTVANRLAARVIANSHATAGAFVAGGGRAGKVRVVYNGIDPRPFCALDDAEIARMRAELGVGEHPVVGVFGRLAPSKGQHVALAALRKLPGVQALIVGDALFGEQQYAAELREYAQQLGVSDRVHFLGFRADVPRLMRLVDVVLHTSVAAEAFGRVIVEGMLAGRPVVATRAGGVPEIVQDGVTGVLVPSGDSDALADAVSALFEQPTRAKVIGEAGRTHALAHFSLDAMLDGVARQIDEVARR